MSGIYEGLQDLRLHELNSAKQWKCDCGEQCDPCSSSWRFNGIDWEHHHGYPVGHVEATRQKGLNPHRSQQTAQ